MTQERKVELKVVNDNQLELKVAGENDLELEAIKIKVSSATAEDVAILNKAFDEVKESLKTVNDNFMDLDAAKAEIDAAIDLSKEYADKTKEYAGNINKIDHSVFALKEEIPELPDLSPYATKEDLENVTVDTTNLVTKEEIVDYALKSELPDISVKQDVISDLEEIRLGASLGKTSIQEHQSLDGYAKLEDIPAPPDLSSYVTDTDLEDALTTLDLSSKQDKLTEEQLANINEDHSKYLTEHQSLDGYAKLTDIPAPQDLSGYALKTELPVVPENVSAFNNDAGYLTEHQDLSSYALKSELPDISTKQDKLSEIQLANINADHSAYLTEHQSLEGYAKVEDIPDISGKQDIITDLAEIRQGASLGKTAIQEHQDLSAYALKSDIPDISVKQDKLSEAQLANINADHSAYLTEHQDISNLALKSEIPSLVGYARLEDIPAPPDLSSYALRTELPDISVKQDKLTTEQMANINADHSKYLTEHQDLSAYALKSEIPEHVDLSGYALKSEIPIVPANVSAFNNDAGYLTQHQDISGKQDIITDLAEIRAGAALGKTAIQAHQDLSAYALKTELPDISVKQDKLSEVQLANINADHSKYLTEHQSLDGYAKLEDIPAPQDLSSYALKSEIPTIPDHSIYALKTEIPDISTKADYSNVYTKTEIDTMLGNMDSVLTALGV